jgi:hypothetical protein
VTGNRVMWNSAIRSFLTALVAMSVSSGCYDSLDVSKIECTAGDESSCPNGYVCGLNRQCCKPDDLACAQGHLDGGSDSQRSFDTSTGSREAQPLLDSTKIDSHDDLSVDAVVLDGGVDIPSVTGDVSPSYDALVDSADSAVPEIDAPSTTGDGPGATPDTTVTPIVDTGIVTADATGGTSGSGGTTGAGGTGGTTGNGGTTISSATGGVAGTGGSPGSGGTVETGGATSTGSGGVDAGMGGSGGTGGTGGTSTTHQRPPAPTSVNASDGTFISKVQISWTAVAEASSYQVFRGQNNTPTSATQLAPPSSPPFDDTTAVVGVVYYYFVKACDSTECSDFSTSDSGYRSSAPPNDDFASATLLTGVPFADSMSVADATTAGDDPNLDLCGLPRGTKSVWYSYTASVTGPVFLDTFGSDYDTTIEVLTGGRGSWTPLWCNDDDARSVFGLNSAVAFDATAGTTYSIVVYACPTTKAATGGAPQGHTLNFHATTFYDVPGNHPYWRYIEGFYAKGITTGCTRDPFFSFCPDRSVTRAEMAVFLLRATQGTAYQPPLPRGIFSDLPVPGKEWMQAWVEELFNEGITTGCAENPRRFCPEDPITRAAMAVYTLRSIKGNSYQPPDAQHIFADLPVPGKEWMEAWVEEFYREGIGIACQDSPLSYCPENPTTRADMAVFISRAYSLPQQP